MLAKVDDMEAALKAWATLPPQAKHEQKEGMAEQLGEVLEMATNLVVLAEAETAAKHEGRTMSRQLKQWGSGGQPAAAPLRLCEETKV